MSEIFYLHKDLFVLGLPATEATELKRDLQNSRNYLKSDYKVHISMDSSVPDHCSTFALSDSIHNFWKRSCEHEHDLECDRCQILKSTLNKIHIAIEKYHRNNGMADRMLHRLKRHVECIEQWKSHLLRSVHQDLSRIDVLNNLDNETVMIYVDWAMKWLPMKYRESTVKYAP